MGNDGYKPWWAIDKEAWREKFAVFYKLTSITEGHDQPLPPWSEKDIEEFQNSDPVYGTQLKLVRQGATIANVGALAGGLVTAAIAWKYSHSAVGAVGAFAGGAVVGWALAEEGASLGLGLYKFDCMDTNLKFLSWWEKKHH
ncbi:unnamed protein product [Sphagnum troendelagicum]|jgi:hypothetical protein|uniref:Succinate dehydrogenase subunit 6, mitochondrial n=3 Tax=Sphagnum TaxID=13804 RepID=A0ABP0TDG8_9BRYO|nr:hypothetical protein BDL97_10G027500 [Sphagnum fallax]KAH8949347.1 hypothetical protein BDL97_10G027500 [Sphagnum fallax]